MTQKNRVYFVIDMKSFFASVECAERGLDAMITNLVVADTERSDTTICLAVSPAMKALGVKNRCRLYEIPKDLEYIIAKPRMKKYIEYAAEIYAIYLKYIDKRDIHVYSIDECIIDVTDYLKIYKTKAKDFAKLFIPFNKPSPDICMK
jgi:DNA polymerase V